MPPDFLSHPVSRRQFALGSTIGVAAFTLLPARVLLAAQDATPESGLADLGLPTLDITVTAQSYEGIPESIEAGRYLVTVSVSGDVADGGGVSFVQPTGMTGAEFVDMASQLAGPPDESGGGSAAATPMEGAMASPAAEGGEMGGPPPFFYDSLIAGGTYVPAGQTAQVVLDLPPGSWVAWGDDPSAPQKPVAFEVTGEMPADLPEPESSATVTIGEYVIEVTEGELTAGQQVIRIDNIGTQPHFVFAATGPEGLTKEEVGALNDSFMTGTPVPGLSEEDFQDVFSTGTQSHGTSQWITADIPPGPLMMICFFPDEGDGMPHSNHGMYTVVDIAP